MARAGAYFDSLLGAVNRLSPERQEYPIARTFLARAQAGLGQRSEALETIRLLRAQERDIPDALSSARMEQWLIWTYALVGEQEAALDHVELLLERPSFLSIPYLRLAQLPGGLDQNPRYRQLVSQGPTRPTS